MAHTVMCVCTVYFTAIVGCAFSSPRHTAGENQQDEPREKEPLLEAELHENITSMDESYDADEGHPETFHETKVDDTGGGPIIGNITSSDNATLDFEVSSNTSTEVNMFNGTEDLKNEHTSTQIQHLIRERHVEGIKEQILSKLRLPYPPKLRGPMPKLPMDEIQKVYSEFSNDESFRQHSNYYAKTVRKFIVGKDVTSRCATKKSAGCYMFDLRGRVDESEVESVHLWIFKLFNHNDPYTGTFIISELEKTNQRRNDLRIKNIFERFETTQKYGWLKIEVTNLAKRWISKPTLNHGMAVICKDCQRKNYRTVYSNKEDSQPFLVVTTRKRHRQEKRSYENECTETSTECCLQPFTIKFEDIGWNAIAYPQSIQANYCTGTCHARYAATKNHTNLIQRFRWTAATAEEMAAMTPCCSPIAYRSQSILYFDGDKLLEDRIPNIAATACGCL